jgi:xanthine dehydrogenase accessory factor
MNRLLPLLASSLGQGIPGVLITVAATRGSAPREPGTAMWVTRAGVHGTIGGGNLEHLAIAQARGELAGPGLMPRLERYPLGVRTGQCCGGVVQLAFERVDTACLPWVERALRLSRCGQAWVRVASFRRPASTARILAGADAPAWPAMPAALAAEVAQMLAAPAATACCAHEALLVSSLPPELNVALFGAGHVGRALVEVLARLPLQLSWFDSRPQELPRELPANVAACCSAEPAGEVAQLPAGTAFLVLTHSHALDFQLVCRVLERGDARFVGLIGSHSKRVNFARRLRQHGFTPAQIASVTCPIGVGAVGKEPEVIAVAVAAQLLGLRRDASAGRERVTVSEQAGTMNAADCRDCSQPCVAAPESDRSVSPESH